MELRHVEGVHVPKLVFDQRAPHFLEAHAHQLELHQVEELAIGVALAGQGARRAQADRVLAEALAAPAPVFEQFRCELGDFFQGPLFGEEVGRTVSFGGQDIPPVDMVVDSEGFVGVAAFDRVLFDDAAQRLGNGGQLPFCSMQLIEQRAQRLRRVAGGAGRFHAASRHDPDRTLLFEGADGAARLAGFEPLARLDVLDREALAGLTGVLERRQDALHRGILFEIAFADLGE